MEKKFDCYKCKWKGSVPGSAHSSCNHPSLSKVKNDPMLEMMAIFASVGMMANSPELNIRGNPAGIRRGWFNFPFSFDPIWLDNCDGFESKAISEIVDL
mgnify:CR=1 FL=1